MGKMVKVCADNVMEIYAGARVRLHKAYGTGTKYFVCYLSPGFCMIADNKKDCREGMGYIHSIHNIEAYEAFI